MAAERNEAELIDELEAGMSEDHVDINVTFTAQLDAWFALNYQKESIRVQYQRMVAMGKRTEQDPNLQGVITQFGNVKEEMDVLEELMIDLINSESDPELMTRMLNASHYYPSKGIGYTAPEGLKTRLQPARKNTPNNGKVTSDNNP